VYHRCDGDCNLEHRLVTATMARYGTPRDAPVAYEEALEKRFSATPDNVINLVALAGAEDAAANAADAP